MPLSKQEQKDLKEAVLLLENPGLAAKLANYLAVPLEKGFKMLPEAVNKKIAGVTKSALMITAKGACFTMRSAPGTKKSNLLHKFTVAATGAVGGFFGMPGLVVELPASTMVMMRSILDIARAEGEDVSTIETKLAALEVFALGGASDKDDMSDTGYYAVRAAMAAEVQAALKYLTKNSARAAAENAPVIVRLIATVAERFGVQVSEKAAVQAVPVIGAFGGAAINTLFIGHYQDMARGHFTIRRLERLHGKEAVEKAYKKYKK